MSNGYEEEVEGFRLGLGQSEGNVYIGL